MASPNMSDSGSVRETTTAFTTFENPFSKTYVRVVFITSYGVVCALCVFGKCIFAIPYSTLSKVRDPSGFKGIPPCPPLNIINPSKNIYMSVYMYIPN